MIMGVGNLSIGMSPGNLSLGFFCEKPRIGRTSRGNSMRRGHLIVKLLRDNRGATAIEYGLIVALIAVAIIVSLQGMGGEIMETWNHVDRTVDTALND